jgi:hypothetical protein
LTDFYFLASYKGWGTPIIISDTGNNSFTFTLSIFFTASIYLVWLLRTRKKLWWKCGSTRVSHVPVLRYPKSTVGMSVCLSVGVARSRTEGIILNRE